jgi:hypothetical protein
LTPVRCTSGHYQKLGFVIVGVMPDANGPGKPDIYMAKRVSSPTPTPKQSLDK